MPNALPISRATERLHLFFSTRRHEPRQQITATPEIAGAAGLGDEVLNGTDLKFQEARRHGINFLNSRTILSVCVADEGGVSSASMDRVDS